MGGALQPRNFPHATTLRKITLPTTSNAFAAAFPGAAITTALADLLNKAEFNRIERIRNLLAHRVSGRRSIRGGSDGTTQWHEETWHIPGSSDTLQFSEMLHGLLNDITSMLTKLVAVARPFAEGQPVQIGRPDL